MVSTQNAKRRLAGAYIHVFSSPMPDGCFVDVGEGVYVASPEFIFILMARELDLVRLIELGYGLCGTYFQREDESLAASQSLSRRSLRDRPRLTSRKKLLAFISRMEGVPGKNRALRALRFMADGSASHMETKLTMLLALPNLLGGYALPMPELNAEVVPPKSVRKSLSQSAYFCDLYWREAEIAVEYDSDKHHLGSGDIAKDAIKRAALALSDTFVITLTKRQVYSSAELERVVRLIAKSIGYRLRYRECLKFTDTHQYLREVLLFSSDAEGWEKIL